MNLYTQNISEIHQMLAPNLKCLFDFSNISNLLIPDKSGNYNIAKFVTAAPETQILSDHIQLNGTSEYITFMNPSSLKEFQEFSIEFWIDVTSTTALKTLFGFSNNSSDSEIGFNFGIKGSDSTFQIDYSGVTSKIAINSALPSPFYGVPKHIIVTFKNNGANNAIKIFVDGILNIYDVGISQNLTYRYDSINLMLNPTQFTAGKIYKFAFYDKVIDDYTALRLYNLEMPIFKSLGLTKKTGTIVTDLQRPGLQFKFE